jgi:uncharacterized membrane protein
VTPFHIVSLPRYDGSVRFDAAQPPDVATVRTARPAVPSAAAAAAAPSSTGLDPAVAAGLAYLAGPFSGAIILLAERTNEYVRFHAWQAIVGLGGLGLLTAGLLVSSFLTLLLSPVVFSVMYRVSEVLAVCWLILWAVCLVNAFSGRRWKLPLVGAYAERRAATT